MIYGAAYNVCSSSLCGQSRISDVSVLAYSAHKITNAHQSISALLCPQFFRNIDYFKIQNFN
jgi:hypothetical protein